MNGESDELHAPWEIRLGAADLRLALEHVRNMLDAGGTLGWRTQALAAVNFINGILRDRGAQWPNLPTETD